ncbi:RNA exonuclease NEF-sp [Labeo rohita]|uniref:RNA exonuclease NEF-sp n=1 Tax=Labeo rohita TaxID=84645 RepID=A0A498NW97_LABRO|nr:RNA exonuclease NEF-sp [Labeo rohita]
MCVLFVGPLPSDATETLVHRLLKRCGRLRTVRLLHYTHGVRRPVHESCLDLDERLSERQNDPLNAHVIYVCNLSSKPHRREDQLQTFGQFGPVTHVTSASEHAGKRGRHAFIKFECADSAQAAVGAAVQNANRKLSVCHALTPPHVTSWTHTRPVTTETSPDTAEQGEECDEPLLERQMKKLDGRVGKVFRALEKNCLSIVILPGHRRRASNETEHKFGSAQDSLMCYECKGSGNSCVERPVICPIGFSNCMSTTTILQIGDTHMEMNQKECIEDCQDTSMNLGISKSAFSCCGTRLCNSRDAPDPRTNAPNGRTCYYCDGQSCSNTVSCSGSEDRCITATGTDRGLPTLVKGCASKHICGARKCSFIQNASCCEGDLCNGDSSVTQAVTHGFIYNTDESVDQSVTQSIVHSFTRTRATKRLAYNDVQNVTERLTYNFAKRVRPKFSFNSYRRVSYRSPYNSAESVKQSFLFLCCSLLCYFLWL